MVAERVKTVKDKHRLIIKAVLDDAENPHRPSTEVPAGPVSASAVTTPLFPSLCFAPFVSLYGFRP